VVKRGTLRVLWVALQVPFLVAFIGYRIGAAVSQGPGVWQDSEGYKAVAASPWFSLRLWAGPRAPLTPVLMKLAGGYVGYGIAQGVLGALAWAFLAYTASRLVSNSWRKPLVTVLILGFAASPLVVMWDGNALSEGPSLSVLALIWACGIWLVRRFSPLRVAALGASVLLYCGLRDADIWTFGIVGVVVIGMGVFAAGQGLVNDERGGRARLRENWCRARRTVTVGAVLLGASALTGAAAVSSHRNDVNVEEAFAVRVFPYEARVAWFASQGMPEATSINALAFSATASPGSAPVVAPDLSKAQWAPLRTWLKRDGLGAYAFFLVTHPGYVLTAPFASPHLTYNDGNGDLADYFPKGFPVASWLSDVFTPNRGVELLVGLAAVLVAGVRHVWRLPEWRFTALFGLLGLWSMLLSWHGEGMEVTRHMVEGNVEVRLGALLALVIALFSSRPAAAASGARDEPDMVSIHPSDPQPEVAHEPVRRESALAGVREGTGGWVRTDG
jgi:hypothetical protein